MRRQNRYIVNGALIVGGIMVIGDILLQWLERKKGDQTLTWENYDGWRTVRNGLWGTLAGGGLGYLVYRLRVSEESKKTFSSDGYLKKILTEENLKSDPLLFKKVTTHRLKIKQWLYDKFGNKLVGFPEDAGSFRKSTAINSNYDLDIIVPFKRNSYASLEDMYYEVYETVGKSFSAKAKVTKQTKAIGLTFDLDGLDIHFDIVPGREINNYRAEKDLNLYVKPEWVWQRGSSFKTNVRAHNAIAINKPEIRRIIKLLKAYRDRNNLELPTVVIDQCVVEALSLDNFGINKLDTGNLLNSMDYIAQKLENSRLIDISNTNNNLFVKMDDWQKIQIANQLTRDINRIESNPRYLKEIFEV